MTNIFLNGATSQKTEICYKKKDFSISISVRPKIRFRRVSAKNKSFGEKVAEFSARTETTSILKI